MYYYNQKGKKILAGNKKKYNSIPLPKDIFPDAVYLNFYEKKAIRISNNPIMLYVIPIKLYDIFGRETKYNRKMLSIDFDLDEEFRRTLRYSITKVEDSYDLAKTIKAMFGDALNFVDGTAGYGGDLIGIHTANVAKKITGFCPNTYNFLSDLCEKFEIDADLQPTNFNVYEIPDDTDIVYLDLPWMTDLEVDFKSLPRMRLYMYDGETKQNLADLCAEIFELYDIKGIFVKVPRNYDFEYIKSKVCANYILMWFGNYYVLGLIKEELPDWELLANTTGLKTSKERNDTHILSKFEKKYLSLRE